MGPDTANGKKGQNGIVYKDAIVGKSIPSYLHIYWKSLPHKFTCNTLDIQNKEYRMHSNRFPPGSEIYIFCDETPFDEKFFKDKGCNVEKKTCCDDHTNAYTWNSEVRI